MSIKKNLGVGLLEAILVLAIGAAIIILSMRQYFSWRIDAQAVQVKENVDAIFQAMGNYYRKNCYGTVDANQVVTPTTAGTLNPISSAFTSPKIIDIQKDLIDSGFLTTKLIPNPLVSATAGTNGYLAQFNEMRATRKECDTCPSLGTIITWTAQVAVKLQDPTAANVYYNILSGDCLSTANGNAVTPCPKTTATTGDYVVWERLPTTSNINAPSTYWGTNPTVAQFKQMYTTESKYKLVEDINTNKQYYLCGD